MRAWIYLLAPLVFVLNLGAVNMELRTLILEAERLVVDLTVPVELKNVDAFKTIQDRADAYLDDAQGLLQSDDLTLQQKLILGYALQSSNFSNFEEFLLKIAFDYRDGEIEETIARSLFFPGMDWNISVLESYENESVRSALRTCLERSDISGSFKRQIKDTLSGKALKDVERFRRQRKGRFF